MLLEALLALTTVLPRMEAGLEVARSRLVPVATSPAAPPIASETVPVFDAPSRAVSNWREEAGAALLPASLALIVRHGTSEPGFVARCVKLNNYWCIKRARWTGELGGDAEGHTAFASAADGADAAALLLGRYYREFGRKSALAIVRRWAPPECGIPRVAPLPRVASLPRVAPLARKSGVPAVSTEIAPRGIGNTLRARFLARNARGAPARRALPTADTALRVQPWSARARLAGHPGSRTALPAVRLPLPAVKLPLPSSVPDIATGIGAGKPQAVDRTPNSPAKFSASLPVRSAGASGVADPGALLASTRAAAISASPPARKAPASLFDLLAPAFLGASQPLLACGGDEPRIRNYAARIADSVGLKPDDDLGLFEADGRPSARLAPVMLAMSSVELGAMRAAPALVTHAIARLTQRTLAGPGTAPVTANEATPRTLTR